MFSRRRGRPGEGEGDGQAARRCVDDAVALARALGTTSNARHLVCECSTPDDAAARGLRPHPYLDGRWQRWERGGVNSAAATLPNGERVDFGAGSSVRYFLERYGSLTWIADNDTHSGDYLGGGEGPWGLVEVALREPTIPLAELAMDGEFAGHGVDTLVIISTEHALDTRAPRGDEYRVVGYWEEGSALLDDLVPDRACAKAPWQWDSFGAWLLAHVEWLRDNRLDPR